ncbi:di-trans,poly-cis-decaprenylcistransferase [Thioclava sp. SK-1]|uniref:glycoside hydrolase family 88/105 protein n=1 Tax=Thioclava sp. SK-1 TaxID=1889770 RepID=UPI000824EB75|nr:glycoside hydrolase family 88 protein [Thioclava sp. SK-1]OCX65673.1 di-trans,poly-cis-decaprenylcistransferase [Thioclava sp. SK-1]
MTVLDYFDAYAARYQPYKDGRWCYEDGCIYRGLVMLHQATAQPRWLDHLTRLTAPQIAADGTLSGYRIEEFNIDNILAGRCLFHLSQQTGDPRYMAAAHLLADQLAHHPRTQAGNYWHKQRYPQQVWLDGLYMALPFQMEYAQATDQPALITDALDQLNGALALTAGPAGLYMHGYDAARRQEWADPVTGQSRAVWARALGWLAMAMVDIAAIVPQRAPRQKTADLLHAIVAQRAPSGLWPQVLDAPQLVGNYDESSASAMFAYALLRASDLGLGAWHSPGKGALKRLIDTRLLRVDGITQLTKICHVAGLGGFDGKIRDGSPGYYLTEDIVADDAKGVGPLMMAVAQSTQSAHQTSAPPSFARIDG